MSVSPLEPIDRPALAILNHQIVNCFKCPRLVAHRELVGRIKRRAYLNALYWSRPIPGFGDPHPRLLVIGLAPGAHGANRTGRMFTGDSSGQFLYRALWEAGFASGAISSGPGDGLRLKETYITSAARCVPPDNKPTSDEVAACRPYLEAELQLFDSVVVVVTLGAIAFNAYLSTLRDQRLLTTRAPLRFGHGREFQPYERGPVLLASYHPSQQNTSTKRLTAAMLRDVFLRARAVIEGRPEIDIQDAGGTPVGG